MKCIVPNVIGAAVEMHSLLMSEMSVFFFFHEIKHDRLTSYMDFMK